MTADPLVAATGTSRRSGRRPLLTAAAIVIVAAVLYLPRLDRVPLHLNSDEILFGVQASALAEAGRDTNGRFLPLYIQAFEGSNYWLQPVGPYLIALVLQAMPLSEVAVRLPIVLMGLATVALVYFVARHIFRREREAVLAALLMTLTPAHLIHSRLASDYALPLPFVLTWLLCLLLFFERRRHWLLLVATSALGVGFYSYVASVVMMPIYLGITCLILLWERASWRSLSVALAGFTWPLLFLPVFLLQYPEILGDFQSRYDMGADPGAAASGLNFMGRVTNTFNARTITERANLYYDFFSPGFLFVSGGSNIMNSTRKAGVFLLPTAVFLLAGVYDAVTRWTRDKVLIVLGFLTGPVAATIVAENYAIDRALALLPFGTLLATLGLARLWQAECRVSWSRVYVPAGVGLVVLSAGYGVWTLASRGRVSLEVIMALSAGAVLLVAGRATERTRRWWPLVVALLVLSGLQYQQFYRDYFGDYGPRSAAWFGNNIRGGLERLVTLADERPAPAIYLSDGIRHVDAYWRFYMTVLERPELAPKAAMFNVERLDVAAMPADSLLLCLVLEAERRQLASHPELSYAGAVSDPNDYYSLEGPGEHVTFVIFRKVGRPAGLPAP